jgi:ssDNA-binding Zn-finger/Zn-ribbon topoisomerase 1
MSNRRRLPRDRKPRCPKCGTRNLLRKTGYGLVCQNADCQHISPEEGAR